MSKKQLALLQESNAPKQLGLDKSKAMAALDNLKNLSSAPKSTNANEESKNSGSSSFGSSKFGNYTFLQAQ